MARGNGAARRWALVATLVAVLAALPALVGAWPAADENRSAAELRTAALDSVDVPFSGFAESSGGLALPVADQLSSLADLFSDRTEMRVWWRGPADNRVDVVTAGGETGFYRDAAGSWTWEYEADRATRTEDAPLALPTPPDLLPNTLARRLLSEAEPDELSRIGADRIAGRDALGLQLTPAAAASSVDRVQIYVDAETGLPIRVQVYGKGAENPALDTRFVDLDLTPPAGDSLTTFDPPPSADVEIGDTLGVLQNAGSQLSPVPLPDTLAGLPRRTLEGAPPAVGIYGRGVTFLAVVPLPYGVAADLRRAAAQDPNAVTDDLGTRLTAGPLGILLVAASGRTQSVITGTVTLDALAQAAAELEGST
ncbi:LolA family protein [Nakamurella sp. GG22]